jgi:hypothetical protein
MTTGAPLMAGKRGLIMGIANDRSLAWGIARAVAGQGAELCVTYQGDALKKRVAPLAGEVGCETDDGAVGTGYAYTIGGRPMASLRWAAWGATRHSNSSSSLDLASTGLSFDLRETASKRYARPARR